MKPLSKWGIFILVGIIAAWAGMEFGHWSRAPQVGAESNKAVASLLTSPLTTLDGGPKTLDDWHGKILVINFWATWCPPCREEIPEFSRSQDIYGPNGVQFVGIAIDNVPNIIEFTKTIPVAYPLLLGSAEAPDLMAQLGNRQQVLPFTVIIDRDGKLHSSHLGRLSGEDLAKLLAPML